MASALLNRKLGLAELRDEFVRSDKVQALMRRVRVTTTDQADPHARDPIGLAELRAKFDDCTGRRCPLFGMRRFLVRLT